MMWAGVISWIDFEAALSAHHTLRLINLYRTLPTDLEVKLTVIWQAHFIRILLLYDSLLLLVECRFRRDSLHGYIFMTFIGALSDADSKISLCIDIYRLSV